MHKNMSEKEEWMALFDAQPHPFLVLDDELNIMRANLAAEVYFEASREVLHHFPLEQLISSDSPIHETLKRVRKTQTPVVKREIALSLLKPNRAGSVDVYMGRVYDGKGSLYLMIQPQSITQKLDRHFHQRDATRSLMSMASVIAHEVKNPLFGIHGSAQLLEATASGEDKQLLQLIKNEAERIKTLVERVEVFNTDASIQFEEVNIYTVLDRVVRSARNGFARHVKINEVYDPSLPPILGDQDQLIQVFMNLIKNAAEAIDSKREDGVIEIKTAYRPGIKFSIPTSRQLTALPLEITIIDNGSGIPPAIQETLFSPFLTTKSQGSGLGLALVAKIIDDHGGMIECQSFQGQTRFTTLLPVEQSK